MADNDFITVEELGAYIAPRAPVDLTDSVLAELAVEGACALVRLLTERELDLVEDDTATFTPDGTTRDLLLPQLPVLSVDEVRVDGEVELDWQLSSAGVVRSTAGRWPAGVEVEVDYDHGFAEIPADLRLLALTIAARAYQQGIARQETTGGASVTWSTPSSLDLSSGEKAIVRKYRTTKQATVVGTGGEVS